MAAPTFQTPSALLAQRAIEAQNGQGYQQPDQVALPGALQALTVSDLEAHHVAGRSGHEIVAHVNAEWAAVNTNRVARRNEWISQVYLPTVERRREAATRAKAEEMRKRLVMEQLIKEEMSRADG